MNTVEATLCSLSSICSPVRGTGGETGRVIAAPGDEHTVSLARDPAEHLIQKAASTLPQGAPAACAAAGT